MSYCKFSSRDKKIEPRIGVVSYKTANYGKYKNMKLKSRVIFLNSFVRSRLRDIKHSNKKKRLEISKLPAVYDFIRSKMALNVGLRENQRSLN